MNAEVSVVMAVKELRKNTIKALNSVLVQSFKPVEIIVVLNGAKDICSPIREQFESIVKFVFIPQLNRADVARNIGIQLSCGNFIAILDDDDYWEQNHLLKSIAALNENENAIASFSGWCNKNEITGTRVIIKPKAHSISNVLLKKGHGLCHSSMVVKKIKELKYPFQPITHDYALWLSLFVHHGFKYCTLSDITVNRVQKSSGLSSSKFKRFFFHIEALKQIDSSVSSRTVKTIRYVLAKN